MKWILIILAILFFGGCALLSKKPTTKALEDRLPEPKIIELIKWKTEYEALSWLEAGLIIGCAAGAIACFMKMPHIGLPVALGCGTGLGLVWARLYFARWMGLAGAIGGVGVLIYAIYYNRRAFFQVVTNGGQNKMTQKMVNKVQKKVKEKNNAI